MRKNDSILNTWVNRQPYSRAEIAKQLKIEYGTLMAWLAHGFIPKKEIARVSKKTGLSSESLMSEYIQKRGKA